MNRSYAVAVLALALVSTSLDAQNSPRSGTRGFHLGLALNGSSIRLDDNDFGTSETDSGGGLNAHLGYNFNPNLGIVLNVAGAAMTDEEDGYSLGHADLALRYTFANATSIFIPYFEGAFTGVAAVNDYEEGELELSGGGVAGAVGINLFIRPSVALDASLWYTRGEFTTLRLDNVTVTREDGIGISGARFNVGVSWYPQG